MKMYLKPIIEIFRYKEDVIRTSLIQGNGFTYCNDCFSDDNW